MDLFNKRCVPCEGGIKPFGAEEIKKYLVEVPGWEVKEEKLLSKEYKCRDFKGSIEFVKKVAAVAEQENHHPDICIFYNKVRLDISTHAIGGLSENDFILAAKINTVV